MAENKTIPTGLKVSAYLKANADGETLQSCNALSSLFSKITGAEAKMWGPSIIGFGDLHYVSESGRAGDWFQCGFALRSGAISIYGLGSAKNNSEKLKKLGKHKFAGGCLQIKRASDIDLSVLEELSKLSIAKTMERYSEEGNAKALAAGKEKRRKGKEGRKAKGEGRKGGASTGSATKKKASTSSATKKKASASSANKGKAVVKKKTAPKKKSVVKKKASASRGKKK